MSLNSERIAQALKQEPSTLDDVSRARIERRLLEAWRSLSAARISLPAPKPSSGTVPKIWVASVAAFVVVAVGGVLVVDMPDFPPK